MKGITPFFWFNDNAEEAVNFYVDTFKAAGDTQAKVLDVARYEAEGSEVSGRPNGSVMTMSFQLNGQDFMALNGGPAFTFSQATSFMVNCENQKEVDYLWDTLSAGGSTEQCGWLKDKFGLSWQIVPTILGDLMSDKDEAAAGRVMHAMLQMTKLNIAELQKAFDQK